jgi:hypothetical protein
MILCFGHRANPSGAAAIDGRHRLTVCGPEAP